VGGKTIKVGCFKALYNKFIITKARDIYKEIIYIIDAFINLLSWGGSASLNRNVVKRLY